jgi:hypothetical protein
MKNTFFNQKGKTHRYIYFIIVGLLLGSFFGSLIHNTVGADSVLISDSILIDSLDDYSKLGFDVTKIDSPVVYEKECLVDGHMPIVIKFNNVDSFSISEKSNLLSSVETSKSGFDLIGYVYKILQSYVYSYQIPVYKNETIIIKDAKNNTESKQIVSVFAYYKDVSEVRYRWVETKDLNSLSVDKNGFIVVDIVGKFKAQLGNRQIDVVPKLSINGVKFTLNKFAWWNSSWSFYKVLSVGNKKDDYSMKLVVSNNSGGNVSCNGHVFKGNYFSDIRFVNLANTTQYFHWMENKTTGIQATFWINNSDNASSLLMYYGSHSAVNTSFRNGSYVFMLFDDFLGSGINSVLWDKSGTVSVSYGFAVVGNAVGENYILSKSSISYVNTYMRTRLKSFHDSIEVSKYEALSHLFATGKGIYCAFVYASTAGYTNKQFTYNTANEISSLGWTKNVFHVYDSTRKGTTKFFYTIDGVLSNIHTAQIPVVAGKLRIYAEGGNASVTCDWLFLARYFTPVPYWSGFGTENSNFVIVIGASNPVNGAVNVPLVGSWCVLINETGGNVFTYSINMNNGLNSSGVGVTNGSKCLAYSLVCDKNYTVWVNASSIYYTTSSVFWFNTVECVFCTYQTYNYTNLSLYWWIDLTSDNDTFNWSIECSNGQNVSGVWDSNGTYGIFLYNLSYNATYKIWVNCSTHLCGTNNSYDIKTGWNINEGDFVMIAGFSMDADLLFLGICLSLWLFLISKYLEYKDMTIAYMQFGLSIPTCLIVVVFSLSYPFGFVIVFLIPILSLSLMVDGYFYRKKLKKK